ncbi:MAG: tetratricopeptide repeat-containing sensor histidine kinase [Psychrobium sp.]|nr:tetratricopeptide repeat-containing sensor histidine kinase [Psychrobium sp.]
MRKAINCLLLLSMLLAEQICIASSVNDPTVNPVQFTLASAERYLALQQSIEHKIATNPDLALQDIRTFIDTTKGKLDLSQRVYLNVWQAKAHIRANRLSKAKNILRDVISLIGENKNPEFKWLYHNTMAAINWRSQNIEAALSSHLNAYQQFNSSYNNEFFRIVSVSNIGYISVQLGYYRDALPHLQQSLAYFKRENIPDSVSNAYNNLGQAFFGLSQYKEAKKLFAKALDIRLTNNLHAASAESYHDLATVYIVEGELKKAKEYLYLSIQISHQYNYISAFLRSKLALANIYFVEQEQVKTLELLDVIIKTAQQHDRHTSLSESYLLQQNLYASIGQYENAFDAAINYHKITQKIMSLKAQTQLAEFVSNSGIVGKDSNIVQLKRINALQALEAKTQQKYNLIYLMIGIIVVLSLLIFLWILSFERQKISAVNQSLSVALNQLRSTQNKLLESEKMIAMTTLVTGMAHQMNTPLGIGLTAVSHIESLLNVLNQALSDGQISKQKMRELMKELGHASTLAVDSINRCSELVDKFKLISSSVEAEDYQEFDLVGVIKRSAINSNQQLTQPISKLHISGETPQIRGYPKALEKVFSQLMLNSAHHAFIDATAVIIEINIVINSESINITFKDNGQGINSAMHDRIFEPFYTSNMGNKNIGIGLSIAYNLVVQLMHGTIEYCPTQQQGSTFSINLPRGAQFLISV